MKTLGILILLTVACVPSHPGTSGTDTSGGQASSGSHASSHGASGPTTSTTTTIGTQSTNFEGSSSAEPTLGSPADMPGLHCDVWSQDCPPGMKCTPFTVGNFLDATHCVSVDADPRQVDEPCQTSGSADKPADNCDEGLVCWYTDQSGAGMCISLCSGNPSNPSCPKANETCVTLNQSGTVNVCLAGCSPLDPACPEGASCFMEGGIEDQFLCVDAADPVQLEYGSACLVNPQCGDGLLCVPKEHVPECGDSKCCTKFCDLAQMEVCPGAPEQVCVKWPGPYPGWEPPANLQNVGFCSASM